MESSFSSSSPMQTSGSFGRAPRPAITATGLLSLFLVAPAAIVIGVIYHFIGQYLDLLIIFPLLAGACVGAVLASLAKKHKIRSKSALIAFGILGGLLCFCARWAGDITQTREEVIAMRAQKLSGGNPALETKLRPMLRRVYSPLRFAKLYMRLAAKEGTTIHDVGSSASSSSNSAITGTGFWLMTALDALLMCGAAAGIGLIQANSPFCVPCDSWYGIERTVSRLHPNQSDEAAKLASSGQWAGLGGLRSAGATAKSHCDILLSRCPGCANGYLSVKRQVGNNIKTLWKGAVTPADTKKLEEVRAQWLQ